jgi:acyl carrier protein
MNEDRIKAAVRQVLAEIAPESAEIELKPEVNFRDQFDFDSVDFLNFTLILARELGIDIPELDYPKLSNLNGCLSYLGAKLSAKDQS